MLKMLLIAVLFTSFTFPAFAADRVAADKGQCRLSFARSMRTLSVSLAFRAGLCHRDRMKGKVAPTVDCNDPWSWTAETYPYGAQRVEHDLSRYDAESKFCTPTISTTAEVGYVSCPAPCDALPVTTFPELGDCLHCIARDALPVVMEAAVGTPPITGDGNARRCQIAIGRNISRYFHKRKKLQNSCEFLVEIEKPPFIGVECIEIGGPGHPFATRINRLRARVADQVRRKCLKADLTATLDLCADDPTAAGECAVSLVDAWAAQIHPAGFPPLP